MDSDKINPYTFRIEIISVWFERNLEKLKSNMKITFCLLFGLQKLKQTNHVNELI